MSESERDGPVESLVNTYVNEITTWCRIGADDPERANEHADEINRLADVLKASDDGRVALSALLDHPERYVRVFAAIDVLGWSPERAQGVLEEAAQSRKPGWFEAEWALKEFKTRSKLASELN